MADSHVIAALQGKANDLRQAIAMDQAHLQRSRREPSLRLADRYEAEIGIRTCWS